ncbi:MAG: hypothetical protein K2X69_13020 [Silvanigrellaceae bacterium]|nr:hypothetical protein [Silvanigrellaceae bacterium]
MRNIFSDIKKLYLLLIALLISSCASSPSGENILMNNVNKNKSENTKSNIKQGKPIYYKAYAYPQILSTGDIWGGGEVFIEMGREKFDLNTIINKE